MNIGVDFSYTQICAYTHFINNKAPHYSAWSCFPSQFICLYYYFLLCICKIVLKFSFNWLQNVLSAFP